MHCLQQAHNTCVYVVLYATKWVRLALDTILKASEKGARQRLTAENNYSDYKGFTASSSGTNDLSIMILRKSETERKRRTEKKSRREIIAVQNEDKKKIDAKFPVSYWFIGLMVYCPRRDFAQRRNPEEAP